MYVLFKNALNSFAPSIMQTLLDAFNHLKETQQPFLLILKNVYKHTLLLPNNRYIPLTGDIGMPSAKSFSIHPTQAFYT